MITIVQTPTNGMSRSLDFYERLNFKTVQQKESVWVTDGKVIIEINPDRYARAGLKLYREHWGNVYDALKDKVSIISTSFGYVLSSPSGTWVYLIESVPPLTFEPEEKPWSVLGQYAGLSLETIDLEKAMEVWQLLGFNQSSGAPDNGWVTLKNGDDVMVSLMKPFCCPHLFFNPSLTYFNGKVDNPLIIEKIRALDIDISEEITYFNSEGLVDNIIIRDPGGFGFFVFND